MITTHHVELARVPRYHLRMGPWLKTYVIKMIQSCGINFYVWEEKKGGNGLL